MNRTPLAALRHISKSFSGVYALTDVSLEIAAGEVLAIVGENGAGKSTLMKVLSGAYAPDCGEIAVDENVYKRLEPMQALRLGISIIHQENLLAPTLSVLENIFAGHELTKGALMDYPSMRKVALQEMDSLGMKLDLNRRVEQLSAAEQQYVKILKAMMFKPRLLIMDEPTSMFNVEDAGKVLAMIRRIVEERGVSIIYISHFLKEVVQIADRIMVLRDGTVVNTYDNAQRNLPMTTLTSDMVGRPVDMFYSKEECSIGEVMFEAKDIRVTPKSDPVSLSVRKGEILGISGMVGSGRTEILQTLCGAAPLYGGKLYMEGKEVSIRKPADAINLGIGYVTEDRQRLGLMLNQSIVENTTIVGLGRKIKGWLVKLKSHTRLVEPVLDSLKVKYHSLWQETRTLSGGNQQKIVVAKWLFADARLILFDEPTRGVDVNAKWEFYKIMNRLAAEGKSIIMVSSDMPELISMSDRVLVVREGRITRELQKDEISENAIIKYALEVENNG
ncbi:sugar ABC transporter ATP-binding protein [Ruthenibacterium lactatiformans]|uniref:sugar ABC transporter ATP-binding protein n=1 Tax=Ruthenibacterium lactatiformans TaxID=1550024 RepID=UPI003AB95F5B